MKIVVCLVKVATARPEEGYSYPSPSGMDVQNSGSSGFNSGNSGFSSGSTGVNSRENQAFNSSYSASAQVPLIHKHIYVHVAPPETEVQQRQVMGQSAALQKHYNIVFIKAPSFSTPLSPIISAQAQNEEKTLIYVLVKRPEDIPQTSIPTVAPTQLNKPEVYFIKYKTLKDSSPTLPSPGVSTGGAAPEPNGRPVANGSNFGEEAPPSGGGGGGTAEGNGRPDPSKSNSGVASSYYPTPSQSVLMSPSQSYGPPGNSGPY